MYYNDVVTTTLSTKVRMNHWSLAKWPQWHQRGHFQNPLAKTMLYTMII